MNTGSWQPGVVYLLGLVFAELIVVGILRSMTRHGG